MIFLRMLLSLLLPAISGVLLTFLLLPGGDRVRPSMLLFRFFTGIGFGLGIASCLQFLCLLAGTPRAVIALDLAVCLALGFTVWFHGRQAAGDEPALVGKDHQPRSGAWFDRLLSPLFGLGLVAWLVSFAVATLREPQGRWDAWLIWNMHARFLYRGGEAWRDAFASGLDWSHWDYPLLLPLSILRGWIYAGQEELRMPAVIALVFTFLTLGLLVSALCVFRHRTQGLLAGLLLLGTPFFIAMGAAQFADVPLAFFILATVTILTWQQRSVRPGALALAGLAAGLAAWTKNEGLLFILVVAGSFTLIMAYRKGLRPA
ncbi:MAG: glycosyltransferase family 39 protein, partial [Syntrophaceae bacterium]|nr:glycosyltransferase family 39 protein [Syntrophaceae bacterium]